MTVYYIYLYLSKNIFSYCMIYIHNIYIYILNIYIYVLYIYIYIYI